MAVCTIENKMQKKYKKKQKTNEKLTRRLVFICAYLWKCHHLKIWQFWSKFEIIMFMTIIQKGISQLQYFDSDEPFFFSLKIIKRKSFWGRHFFKDKNKKKTYKKGNETMAPVFDMMELKFLYAFQNLWEDNLCSAAVFYFCFRQSRLPHNNSLTWLLLIIIINYYY